MLESLGLIGNCQCAALVSTSGNVAWACLPRFDSEPVFASLLDAEGGGHFTITPADGRPGTQRYLENTNVLETRFESDEGAFRVLDFCPRLMQYDRTYRPSTLVRIVEPLSGAPRISVSCDPRLGWSKASPVREQGSHHVSYRGYGSELRLTTDAPLSYLGSHAFALTGRRYFALTYGAPVEEPLASYCNRMFSETVGYWRRWVKHCDVPLTYQEEVIRSALTLKLHCFEDTGAIVAALTTSIPEAPESGRTWDYRYCWLRDSYYTLGAFRRLGQFEEREQFLHYLLDVAGSAEGFDLAPLYRIDGKSDLDERIVEGWKGFLGHGPVRVGNGAAQQRQNDVFGEMVLALSPLCLDARFRDQQTESVLDLLEGLTRKAIVVAERPDAGIWEFRSEQGLQTFSSLMCWAGVDRMALIAARHRPSVAGDLRDAAERIRAAIFEHAVDRDRGNLVARFHGRDVDAALLQAVPLRLFAPRDPRAHATVDVIRDELGKNGWLQRYRIEDDFGETTSAFVICTFWLAEALATIGRVDEARALMERIHEVKSPLGLLAEDLDPRTGTMWGNFPQAYSHVGLINAAFAASPSWSEIL